MLTYFFTVVNIDFIVLETPHVIVGAAIAVKISNPLVSLPLALVSHFALEKIPHWNPHLNTEIKKFGRVSKNSTSIVIVDSTLALLSGTVIALGFYPELKKTIIILTACFLSILPDLIEAPYFFLKKGSGWILKWIKFQKSLQSDTTPFWGTLTQISVIVVALWWIFN